jgi:hypothetical protein
MQFFFRPSDRQPASRPSSATQAEELMPIEIDKAAILKLLDDVRKAHQEKNAAKIVSLQQGRRDL